ncbi:hypothetical protein BMF94_0862 [Rhodotorula taiwanensis]|uniref:Ribosome recycling factor domain-containing protein n=1 Tax=Rhodotorula taiwanensis TaxID=741276 RepID=A0A2S5BH86_9BASI|nr:hypothetical protein BMF94_0862 [Rhodotorula taiwanensis]
MAYRIARTAFRPAARLLSAPAPVPARIVASALSASSAHSSPPSLTFVRTKKTKPSKQTEDAPDGGRGSAGKKGKGKGKMLTEDDLLERQLPGEHFELKVLEERMQEAIDRLRVSLNAVVGRVGRITPALLDGVKVDTPEGKRPLLEFANVSVKDGRDLLVTCYEESSIKAVSSAIYASPLNLAPQPSGASSLRVPVPRPDLDKRQQYVRDAQALCEKARNTIRAHRVDGQKDIKKDVDAKVVGTSEARTEGKKLDDATKKKTAEVDKIFEDVKRVLLDE